MVLILSLLLDVPITRNLLHGSYNDIAVPQNSGAAISNIAIAPYLYEPITPQPDRVRSK
jgi:hypothetical protein